MLPASCARKSSATASGLREALRYSSSMSRRISFPSTIFTGGMQRPSPKEFSGEPRNEEGERRRGRHQHQIQEHTTELQPPHHLGCRLPPEKKKGTAYSSYVYS